MNRRPLQVVTACRACDLPILEIAAPKLAEFVPLRGLTVIAPDQDCALIRDRLGSNISVRPENEFIPGMKLEQLFGLKTPHFPQAAGWYFQQFLKLQFAFVDPEDDYYLIWDADTVPLRAMTFFDSQQRMLLTKATEYHPPYFETYRNLFGAEPNREFSFIAQHMVIQKSVAREMLARIEHHVLGKENWAWKIMRSLPASGDNLFSEYETYGHFIKNHYPDRVNFIDRSWQRDMKLRLGRRTPSAAKLKSLAQTFDYAAFEKTSKTWRRAARNLKSAFFRRRPLS